MADEPCLHCLVIKLIKEQIAAKPGIDVGEIIASLLQVIGEVIAASSPGEDRKEFIAATVEELPRRINRAVDASASRSANNGGSDG